MPQTMPMNWILIFMILNFTVIFMLMMNYQISSPSLSNPIMNKLNLIKWSW